MMESCYHDLLAWGVPEKKLHSEAFGPSSLKKASLPDDVATSAKILFKKSKKTLSWEGGQASLLELAESQGLKLRFGYRGGACGTCKVGLLKGSVAYSTPPGAHVDAKHCLVCISLPKGDLEIDA